MDYYSWYAEKYSGGWLIVGGEPFCVSNVSSSGSSSVLENIRLHDEERGLTVSVTDESIEYDLPVFDCYIQCGHRCTYAQYRVNRTYRYSITRDNLCRGQYGVDFREFLSYSLQTEYMPISRALEALNQRTASSIAISEKIAIRQDGRLEFKGQVVGKYAVQGETVTAELLFNKVQLYPAINSLIKVTGVTDEY